MSAADLEKLARAAGDLACLVAMASDLADEADGGGDMGAIFRAAVLLRSIRAQSKALHVMADAQWIAADRAEQKTQGGAA